MKHETLIFALNEQIDYLNKLADARHKEMKEIHEEVAAIRRQQDALHDAIKALKAIP